MADTKANITTQIQDALSSNGGLTTHAQHESFLITEPDSILENLYPAETQETHSSNSITSDNANVGYDVKIVKIGREVTINGFIQNVSGANLASPTLFSIDAGATAYIPNTNTLGTLAATNFGTSIEFATGEGVLPIYTDSNDIKLLGFLGALEVRTISITYNTNA